MRKSLSALGAILLASIAIQSCTTVAIPGYTSQTKWRIGVTRIKVEDEDEDEDEDNRVSKNELKTLGIWWDDESKGLGLMSTKVLSVPRDCRIVILVKNQEQLDNLKKFLALELRNNKEDICVSIE